jgi:hypothetical protein
LVVILNWDITFSALDAGVSLVKSTNKKAY